MRKKMIHAVEWITLAGSTMIVCLLLLTILYDLFSKGIPNLSWTFLTHSPSDGMTTGGIFPVILGTILVTALTCIAAAPFGIACAIYLNEYATNSTMISLVRASIRNLAGVPSIIYGLFGLALFVQSLRLGTSLLAAGLTLGLLSLPYIITTSEEALKRVSYSLREASMAVGATHFETIRYVVLPRAMPGILTGIVLTLSRSAGETAPILFTGAAFYINGMPGLNREFMALPYHLYMLSTQHESIETVRPLAYGTAVVLILVVLFMNLLAFFIRHKYRKYDAF